MYFLVFCDPFFLVSYIFGNLPFIVMTMCPSHVNRLLTVLPTMQASVAIYSLISSNLSSVSFNEHSAYPVALAYMYSALLMLRLRHIWENRIMVFVYKAFLMSESKMICNVCDIMIRNAFDLIKLSISVFLVVYNAIHNHSSSVTCDNVFKKLSLREPYSVC